jgi:hypothetical protein
MGGFESGFAMMQGIFVLFFIVVAALIIFTIVKSVGQKVKNAQSPEVSAVAEIRDKRIELSGGGTSMIGTGMGGNDLNGIGVGTGFTTTSNPVHQRHYVTFEQADGTRFELEVPPSEYGLLSVGDRGSVSMKGTQYLGFSREVLR